MHKLFFIMYSPRRFTSKKKYYKKRYYNIKDIYSPSLYGAPTPNYYQMKGRTIQQSPARMRDVNPFMMSSKRLNDMYQTLIQYKYKFPVTIYQPFMVNYKFTAYNLFGSSAMLTRDRFKIMMDAYMNSRFPDLFTRQPNWQYRLFYFQLENANEVEIMEDIQFHVDLYTNLIGHDDNPVQIVFKTLNNPLNPGTVSPTMSVQPVNNGQLRVYRLIFMNSGNFAQSSTNIRTTDPDINDQGFYPIMDTDARDSDLYASQIEWVGPSPPQGLGFNFICDVLCIPK